MSVETAASPTADPRRAPFVCAFDGSRHESLEALHDHLKAFRVSRKKYYHQFYPRRDPLTGTLIPFRDLDQYMDQEFESKVTLKKWLKENPEEGYAWAKDWLARRKEAKGLVYAPSQAELRTLCCPSMPYYDAFGKAEGGYYGITRDLGYADRYTAASLRIQPLQADACVICDTREQDPIDLSPAKTSRETLSVGDYALCTPYDTGIRIERKSLGDFCGTMSDRKVARKGGRRGTGAIEDSAFQRFDRELARAQEAGLYVVMMVEENINTVQSFNYLPQYRWIKASPQYLLHNLRVLLARYPLIFQVLFVDGRDEMTRLIPLVLNLGTQVKTVDLQHRYEKGLL